MYRILVALPGGTEAKAPSACEAPTDTSDRTSPSPHAHKVANVSLELDGDLAGLTLTGFSIWNNGDQGLRVSFPTRRFIADGGSRGSFLILRATDRDNRTAYERLKGEILDAYRAVAQTHAASSAATEAA